MSIISKEHWQSIQKLLDQVLDLPESERASFIDEACATQPDLKKEILDLLEAEKKSPTFLDRPAQELYEALITSLDSRSALAPPDSHENSTIGAFKLIKEIGRGGMGAVYLAERCVGDFEQTVAIKVLSNSGQNKDILERFKREQQLLASLDHPNIAKLYDGGIGENGQAYLIMEYVDGHTIDTYCNKNNLDIDARLELIKQVANAAGFAHKHLIIHRDLKPSNILVKNDGTVKLLDFSIAKLVDQQEDFNLTQAGHTPMTPGYAAPEQLRNKPVSITTDIYQLGLVMYLLLTGVPAHDKANTSLASLVKQVCEEVPLLPSKHSGKLRGDLDAIMLKMLQIEPEQRYPTMDAFLRDLHAYYYHLPVSARHASWIYLSKRSMQRHWKAVLVASTFLVLLSGYALTTTWQARKIELALQKSRVEQTKAEQVSGFLINVFNSADPNVSGFDSITVQQLMEDGEKRIIDELELAPSVQNHMLNILAEIWQRQGNYTHSQEILSKARASAMQLGRTGTPEFALTQSLSGFNFLSLGQNDLAIQYSQKAVDLYEQLISEKIETENDEYAYIVLTNAVVLSTFGRNEEARPMIDKVIQVLNETNGNIEYLGHAYSELSIIQHVSGEFEAARINMEKAAELQKRVTGENHSYYTTIITNLAIFYQDAELFDEAEKLAREALRIHENIFGSDHPLSIHAKRTTAVILHRKGDLDEAEDLLRNIVKFESTLEQANSYESLSTRMQLGAVLQDEGKFEEAESHYKQVLDQLNKQPNRELHGRAIAKLADLKYQQKKFQGALELYEQALSMFEQQSIIKTVVEVGIAQVLLEKSRNSEALEFAKRALERRKRTFLETHSWIIESELVYGMALYKSAKTAEANSILEASLKKARTNPGFQFGGRLQLFKKASNINN